MCCAPLTPVLSRKEGPPSPPKIATALQVGKFSLQDDYAWMQPPPGTVRAPVEVAKHIAAENDWTDRFATKRFSVAKTLLRVRPSIAR